MMSRDQGVTGTSRMTGQPGTHVIDHGGPTEAPLVVLLHGFGGSALNWQLVGPNLAQHYRVVAVDFFAHGRSGAPRKLRAELVASQIGAVIDAESVSKSGPVILVAGSFGATIAFLVARERPGVVSAVVAVNGAIPVHPGRRLDMVMTVKRWMISAPGVSALIFRKTSSMTAREYVELQLTEAGVDPEAIDPGLMAISVELEDARHHDRAAHDSQQWLLRDLLRIFARGRSFSAMAAAVGVPVLWLHSDTDPLIPFDLAKEFVAAHPGWEFRSRAGLGHVPMVVDPGWVSEEILSWLDQQ
jgi:pimeloyl-ACP methyl ester carboxylesterase